MMKSDSDRVVYAVHKNINFVKNITVPAAVIHASFGDSSVYDVDPPVQMFFKINEVNINIFPLSNTITNSAQYPVDGLN